MSTAHVPALSEEDARGALEDHVLDLTRAYERALRAAVTETDRTRAAKAFDAADRLQQKLLRATQHLRRVAKDATG